MRDWNGLILDRVKFLSVVVGMEKCVEKGKYIWIWVDFLWFCDKINLFGVRLCVDSDIKIVEI